MTPEAVQQEAIAILQLRSEIRDRDQRIRTLERQLEDAQGRSLPRLVRDRIPERLGRTLRQADRGERLVLLRKKIVEEAHELHDARGHMAVVGELVDLTDVIHAFGHDLGVGPQGLALARREKHRMRGAFLRGWVLDFDPGKEEVKTDVHE